MGIKGLWTFIEPLGRNVSLQELRGKKIAVDISIWINKIIRGFNYKNGCCDVNKILKVIFNKLCELLILGIYPIFVFDGKTPYIKKKTVSERKMKRTIAQIKAESTKNKLTKSIMVAHALNQNIQEPLSVLKRMNSIDLDTDNTVIDKNYNIPANFNDKKTSTELTNELVLDDFDHESDLYKSLAHEEKIQFLSDLKRRIQHRFVDQLLPYSHEDFSKNQLSKLHKIGQVENMLKQLTQKSKEMLASNLAEKSYIGDAIVEARPLFSNDSEFLLLLNKQCPNKYKEIREKEECSLNDQKIYGHLSNLMKPLDFDYKAKKRKTFQIKSAKIQEKEELSSGDSIEDFTPPKPTPTKDSLLTHCSLNVDLPKTDKMLINCNPREEENTKKLMNGLRDEKSFQNTPMVKLSSTYSPKDELLPINKETFNEISEECYKFAHQSLELPFSIFDECIQLITLFGFPHFCAPAEAEVQCSYFNKTGICDMVATEDSDSLMFGSKIVCRGLFDITKSRSKRKKLKGASVKIFKSSDLKNTLYLDDSNLVVLAMLAGCDYTPGLDKVGVSFAYRILSTFYSGDGLITLSNFKKFVTSQLNSEQMSESLAKILKKLKSLVLPDNFPSSIVYKSLVSPVVDVNQVNFQFLSPNYSHLELYLEKKLGFSKEKINDSINLLKKSKSVAGGDQTLPFASRLSMGIDRDSAILLFPKSIQDASEKLRVSIT